MMGAVLAMGYALLFLLLVQVHPFFRTPGARVVSLAFLLKLVAGTGLWYIYTYVHTDRATADIYRYFDDGNIMFGALHAHPLDYLRMLTGIGNDQVRFDVNYYQVMHNWYRQYEGNLYNDAHTMIRFNAFVRLFSFGHYHVHTVFACAFSVVGLVALYRAFAPLLAGHGAGLVLASFLLPSVVFWASGVIKEALLLFGLGLFLLGAFRLVAGQVRSMAVLLAPFALVLLFFLKFYVLLSLIPALAAYAWCRRTGDRRPLLKFAITYATCTLLALNSTLIYPGFNVFEVLWVKQRDFIGMAEAAEAGSLVDVPRLDARPLTFLKLAPHALYMTFLSPMVHGLHGALGLMSAVENIALLIVLGLAWRWRRPWPHVDRTLLLLCTGYCATLALVIGWTTPVIGALVRYRVPLLPFLVIAALCLADPQRIPWPAWYRRLTRPA